MLIANGSFEVLLGVTQDPGQAALSHCPHTKWIAKPVSCLAAWSDGPISAPFLVLNTISFGV